MNNKIHQKSITSVRGYLEGYYGKLLSWNERIDLLNFLSSQNFSSYCYAPKEDAKHRLHWRDFYSSQWHKSFSQFCQFAKNSDISVIAGIAPGLDFEFDLDGKNKDLKCLFNKANELLKDGANEILILWDDIDDDAYIAEEGLSEGAAHAEIINRLSDRVGQPLWTVPRVYAAEIENKKHYLEDFFGNLQPQHTVLLCGNAIVSHAVELKDLIALSCPISENDSELKHRTVVWDNFYANDYCPRRLFLGPWTGREQISDYLLNPTGMPFTDQLLLDIAQSTHTSIDNHEQWIKALQRHGVPDAFQEIAPYFLEPFYGDRNILNNSSDTTCPEPTKEVELAIEECLWKWKSPLAREWYPFIFGLKHDLALTHDTLPRDRVLKTQTPALAKRLLS